MIRPAVVMTIVDQTCKAALWLLILMTIPVFTVAPIVVGFVERMYTFIENQSVGFIQVRKIPMSHSKSEYLEVNR